MEVLRFGSQIPGAYHGCCAVDIVQNFKVDPDAPASIQCVHGDSGTSLGNFLGVTYREIFLSRLRCGTFATREMPCHAFLAVISSNQLRTDNGKKWLGILRENGFEFIRAVHNSVYGDHTISQYDYKVYPPKLIAKDVPFNRPVYVFGLFRNIGLSALPDPFAPPEEWTSLPEAKAQQELWDAGKLTLYTEKELRKKGVPVVLAGKTGEKPKEKPVEPEESALLQPLEPYNDLDMGFVIPEEGQAD